MSGLVLHHLRLHWRHGDRTWTPSSTAAGGREARKIDGAPLNP